MTVHPAKGPWGRGVVTPIMLRGRKALSQKVMEWIATGSRIADGFNAWLGFFFDEDMAEKKGSDMFTLIKFDA